MGADHLDAKQLGRLSPLSIVELSKLMLAAPFRWCLVGGMAIDHTLGRPTRHHDDIDIAVFRTELPSVREWLTEWEFWYAKGPGSGLFSLEGDDQLPDNAHEIWCRRLPSEPWRLEILVERLVDAMWIYRRYHEITLPIEELIRPVAGVPVMAPEVVLLYKAKNPRDRDMADFKAALPLLDAGRRDWLRTAISEAHPDCPWLADLQ